MVPGTEQGDAGDIGAPATNGDLTRKPETVG